METQSTQESSAQAPTIFSSEAAQNMSALPQPPVVIMVPGAAPIKRKRHYEKHFPKKTIMILSAIQIAMAFIAITTQIVAIVSHQRYYSGTAPIGQGIWCGVFFGISGLVGILAGYKPSTCSILTSMILSIVAASFCVPFLIMSSIFVVVDRWEDLRMAMFAIQIVTSLVQAVVVIWSSVLACKATCACCRKNDDEGVVYFTANTPSSSGIAMPNTQLPPNNEFHQQIYPANVLLSQPGHQGYIAIPVNQIPVVGVPFQQGGATALDQPNVLTQEASKIETPPPNYASVTSTENNEASGIEGKNMKYQRF